MRDKPPTALTLYLADHDVPCPNPACKFNLRGLEGRECPECREPLILTFRDPAPLWYMRKWVVAASALVVVVNTVSITRFVSSILRTPAPSKTLSILTWPTWTSLVVSLSVLVALAVALVQFHRRLWRRRERALPMLMLVFVLASIVSSSHSLLNGLYRLWTGLAGGGL